MRSVGRFVTGMASWYTVMFRDVLTPEMIELVHRHVTLWKAHHHVRS